MGLDAFGFARIVVGLAVCVILCDFLLCLRFGLFVICWLCVDCCGFGYVVVLCGCLCLDVCCFERFALVWFAGCCWWLSCFGLVDLVFCLFSCYLFW